jgi:DNA repair exonuclease SbcCD nuclease subunit
VRARIPLVLLEGNHERLGVPSDFRTATATLGESLAAMSGAEVFFAEREPKLFTTSTGIQVAAFPWLAQTAQMYAGMSPDAADAEAAKLLAGRFADLAGQADRSVPLVLASHVSVSGATQGSEDDLGASRFHEPVVPVSVIDQCGYGFAGLSHIHARQHLGDSVWFSGSPNRLTFTDADKAKSANVAYFDGPRLLRVERPETPARAMTSIDLEGGPEAIYVPRGALVRLVLAPGEIDVPDWAVKAVESAGARLERVKKRPLAVDTAQRVSLPERTAPHEALLAWMARENIPETDRGRLSLLADDLLKQAAS